MWSAESELWQTTREWAARKKQCDQEGVVGHIITNERMETSMSGVFACGDVRSQLVRQITNAVGDGTTAAVAAEQYIESLEDKQRTATLQNA